VRSLTWLVTDSIPGVSMRTVVRSWLDGHRTSTRSVSSADAPSRSNCSAPSTRLRRSRRVVPSERTAVASGVSPCRYQVTMRVHSPASVGAIRSPISAFNSVDLPALTMPATPSRSGSSSRRRQPCSCARTSGTSP